MGDWLEHVGLPQYESKLLLNGFDDLHYMVSSSLLSYNEPNSLDSCIHFLPFDFSLLGS